MAFSTTITTFCGSNLATKSRLSRSAIAYGSTSFRWMNFMSRLTEISAWMSPVAIRGSDRSGSCISRASQIGADKIHATVVVGQEATYARATASTILLVVAAADACHSHGQADSSYPSLLLTLLFH